MMDHTQANQEEENYKESEISSDLDHATVESQTDELQQEEQTEQANSIESKASNAKEEKVKEKNSTSIKSQDGLLFSLQGVKKNVKESDQFPNVVKLVNDCIKDSVTAMAIKEIDFDKTEFRKSLQEFKNESLLNVLQGEAIDAKNLQEKFEKYGIEVPNKITNEQSLTYKAYKVTAKNDQAFLTGIKEKKELGKPTEKTCFHNQTAFKIGVQKNSEVRKYTNTQEFYKQAGVQFKIKKADAIREPNVGKFEANVMKELTAGM